MRRITGRRRCTSGATCCDRQTRDSE